MRAPVIAASPVPHVITRCIDKVKQLHGPIVALASVGAVASGQVGYCTADQIVATQVQHGARPAPWTGAELKRFPAR